MQSGCGTEPFLIPLIGQNQQPGLDGTRVDTFSEQCMSPISCHQTIAFLRASKKGSVGSEPGVGGKSPQKAFDVSLSLSFCLTLSVKWWVTPKEAACPLSCLKITESEA